MEPFGTVSPHKPCISRGTLTSRPTITQQPKLQKRLGTKTFPAVPNSGFASLLAQLSLMEQVHDPTDMRGYNEPILIGIPGPYIFFIPYQ